MQKATGRERESARVTGRDGLDVQLNWEDAWGGWTGELGGCVGQLGALGRVCRVVGRMHGLTGRTMVDAWGNWEAGWGNRAVGMPPTPRAPAGGAGAERGG